MCRTEVLQFLDVLGEQQPRVLIKPHIEFSGVLAEQPGQAGRRGRCGVQDDFAQAHAVHQRTAAEFADGISQFDAFKVSHRKSAMPPLALREQVSRSSFSPSITRICTHVLSAFSFCYPL